MRHIGQLLGIGLVAATVAACGDNFGTGTFTQMEVIVENTAFQEETGSVFIPPAVQQPVFKVVKVVNTGTSPLKVTKVDWAVGADGAQLKNPHVDIDWQSTVAGDSFPWTVDPDNINALAFSVKYTPPTMGAATSLEDSVLEIHSNARTTDGRGLKPIVRITFSLRSNAAFPRVTPTNYRFTNATVARPESQDFRIYNDDGATTSFRVLSVRLETPSEAFRLSNVPSGATEIPAPADAAPGQDGVVFTCTYTPTGSGNDQNAILIETDVSSNATLRVPLTTGSNPGSYSLSFDNAGDESKQAFDFTSESTTTSHNVQVTSEGPGPITIKQPRIEPEAARRNFSVKVFAPATQAGQADTEVTAFPRGVNVGRALRVEITFTPTSGGGESANGELIIPYENPNPGEFTIPLFSGNPKGRIVLAPVIGNLSASGSIVNKDKGTRQAVIYNEGNGNLEIRSIAVVSNLAVQPPQPAKAWSLGAGAPTSGDIAPNGLLVVPLAYDLSGITSPSGMATDLLKVTYFDDFTGEETEAILGLVAADANENALPTANPGDASAYASARAGTAVTLSGAASSPGGGTFGPDSFVWFLAGKPAGSRARLNAATAGAATFLPDVAGAYEVVLIVFSEKDATFLFSAPATVRVNVAQ
jgi:hypothetical protein